MNKESRDKYIDNIIFYGYLLWLEESYHAPLWKRIKLWFKYQWVRKLHREINR